MPKEKVVSFFNTLDVEGLWQAGGRVTDNELAQARERLNLKHKQVLLFSGRLYPEKHVDFLLRAFVHIQSKQPETALLILGDGQERCGLERLCETLRLHHVHFLGEITDPAESSIYFRLAQLLVIPGLVGLAIVHGLAFNVPLVTTERDFHSPEIEYLSNENGCMTVHDPQVYADEIVRLLSSASQLSVMQQHCAQTARHLTMTASASRFMQALHQFTNSVGLRSEQQQAAQPNARRFARHRFFL